MQIVEQPVPRESRGGIKAMAPMLLREVAAPTLAYYALHALGVSDWGALLGGALVSGGLLVAEAVKARRLEIFSLFMLAVFTIGLATSLLSGDPRFLVAKESLATGIIGLAFLVSAVIGRPLIYYAARRMAGTEEKRAAFEAKYRANPVIPQTMRSLSYVWGVGLLIEAVVRVVLAYRLPISTMVWLSTALMIVSIGVLVLVTGVLGRRAKARFAAA